MYAFERNLKCVCKVVMMINLDHGTPALPEKGDAIWGNNDIRVGW